MKLTIAVVFLSLAMTSCAMFGGKKKGHICLRHFKKMDTNGDNKVSLEEWRKYKGQKFEKMDADANGMITVDEWENAKRKHRKSCKHHHKSSSCKHHK